MNATVDEILLLLGAKEVEIWKLRGQVADLEKRLGERLTLELERAIEAEK